MAHTFLLHRSMLSDINPLIKKTATIKNAQKTSYGVLRMKKCLIVYFSQGGTTKKTGEAIAAGFQAEGWETDLVNLNANQNPPLSFDEYDIIGFGAPTYFYKPPFNVTEYIEKLPDLNGKPFFVYILFGTYKGDAGNFIRKTLTEKNGKEAGYLTTRGADMFLGYLREGALFSPDRPNEEDLSIAEKFGKGLANGNYDPSIPKDQAPAFLNKLERLFLTPYLFNHIYTKFFKVNSDLCISCGICKKVCPTCNIEMDEDKKPVWGRDCIGCINCEMKCPTEAITSPFAWPLSKIFLKMNVYKASHDPEIVTAPVKQKNGKLIRL